MTTKKRVRGDVRLRNTCKVVAVALWLVHGLALPVHSTSFEHARGLHLDGRYDAALVAYREAAGELAESDPGSAASARNNACLILIGRGDYPAALEECTEAIRLRRIAGDEQRLARTSNNLALTWQHLGRYAEAEAVLREALAINERLGDLEAQVINHGNLGGLARVRGRYAEAVRWHSKAVALTDQQAQKSWSAPRRRIALINQANVLLHLGAAREALGIYRSIVDDRAEMTARRRAALQVNMAIALRHLGDPVKAEKAFTEAADTYQELGDSARLSNALLNLGLTKHLGFRDLTEAEGLFSRALALAREAGDRPEEIQDLFYLGRLHLGQGRSEDAEQAFTESLRLAEESGSAEGIWSAREGLGRTAELRGDLQAALSQYRLATAEIESVRSGLSLGTRRSGFFGDKRHVYEAAVGVLLRLAETEDAPHYVAAALEVVQEAKARELLDSLGPDGREQPPPASVAEIQKHLDQRTLFEYFVADDSLLLWIVGSDSLEVVNLGSASSIFGLVERVYMELSQHLEPDHELLGRLSRTLLYALPEHRNGGRLMIAPDRELHYLPFELLHLTGEPDSALVDSAAVSYLPSGSTLVELASRERQIPDRVISFGNPLVPEPSPSATEGTSWLARIDLAPLPASRDELASVLRWLPGRAELWMESEATESRFRESVTRGAKLVHLATHSLLDESRPGAGAAILLTPEGGDDGLLFPQEIAALDYKAQLTVIAACRSALSATGEGLALSSLTGAFLAAGSDAVVATLWDVGDQATAVFMEQFYYQLGRGLDPARALQKTKQILRADERWQQPSLWAGYVLVGESLPLAPGDESWRWSWFAAALILLLLAAGWLLARSRRE